MSKYKKGSTSAEKMAHKKAITQCIKVKAKLIQKAIETKELPESLPLTKGKLNLGGAYSWADQYLNVFKFAANTVDAPHNQNAKNELRKAILDLNLKLKSGHFDVAKKLDSKKRYKTRKDLELEIKDLKFQNDTLTNIVVEIYRSYMQILHIVEQEELTLSIHKDALRAQSKILSNEKLELIRD